MRKNESDAAAHTPQGGVFSWKKEDFDQKRWDYCEKRVEGVCVRLVPSNYSIQTTGKDVTITITSSAAEYARNPHWHSR